MGLSGPFDAMKLTDDVYWVGAIDWTIRNFHGYSTHRGTTYNAYLVMSDKVTLIDTVKAPFIDEMLSRVASVVAPDKIDYVVSNHSEMDHSGGLPEVIGRVGPERVFASPNGIKALAEHFGELDVEAVKDGDTLSIGKDRTLTFLETKMLHWPDSMVSYLGEEELLFPQDGFGMHLASSRRFADEIDQDVRDWEAAKYYANILLPLSGFVKKLLARIGDLGLKFSIVAPDHGPIYRTAEDIDHIVSCYARWAEQKPAMKAVVVYDTMWQSTDKMARAICEGLTAGGVDTRLFRMQGTSRADVATEILEAGALIVGSPTMNNMIFPTLADVMCYLQGLEPRNKVGAVFGSYGWSGASVKQLKRIMTDMGVELVADEVSVKYQPTAADLAQCRALGEKVAEALEAKCEA